jgi:heme-degrading monooxygenase HmoA
MLVSVVRFRSRLADELVQAKFEDRAQRYRDVPGLVEKIYVQFRKTGEIGAIYLWDSEEALMAFRESELARTIADGVSGGGGSSPRARRCAVDRSAESARDFVTAGCDSKVNVGRGARGNCRARRRPRCEMGDRTHCRGHLPLRAFRLQGTKGPHGT